MRAKQLPKPASRPFQLSLHIRHPTLDPQEISQILQLQAGECFKAGAPRDSQPGARPTSVHRETYWAAELQTSLTDPIAGVLSASEAAALRRRFGVEEAGSGLMASLDVALSVTSLRFMAAHRDFLERLQREGGTVRLLVTIAPSELKGFTVVPEVSRLLAALGIIVEFEFIES